MDYRIRRGQRDDAESLTRVHLASWRTTYQGMIEDSVFDDMERQIDLRIKKREERFGLSGVSVFVALSPERRIVGFVEGGPAREKIGVVRPRTFYVKLGARFLKIQSVQIGHQDLDECAYGWDDLAR